VGKLFKRGETWYADYRDQNNVRRKISLRTSDRQVARTRLRDAELGTTSEAPDMPKALGDAINEMIALKKPVTAKSYKEHALHLFRIFGADLDINTLTRAAVGDYCTTRLKDGATRHTIHKELVVLRQALKESKLRNEFVGTVNVVPSWKAEYEPETRWLTPDEFGRLLKACPGRRTWLMVMTYTGAELGAMRRLTWHHVDLKHGLITIPGTKKSSRYRVGIPLHPDLKAYLKTLPHDKPLLIPWSKIHKQLKAACKRAGIEPPVTPHDLRRTFGSWLVQNKVDLHHVARLMGNTYNMVSKVYGQTSDESYATAIGRLPKVKKNPRKAPTKPPRKDEDV
jgi:integrase